MVSQRARETAERDLRALELRRAGLTFDAIATRLDLANKGSAHKAVQRALKRSGGPEMDPDSARELEADRLDRLQTAAWPAAMKGNLAAIEKCLRISAARCRLLGLERELLNVAPESTPGDGAQVHDEGELDRLRRERREREVARGATTG